jgi:hypothetical protein
MSAREILTVGSDDVTQIRLEHVVVWDNYAGLCDFHILRSISYSHASQFIQLKEYF